jgi:hypothetical protein
MVIARSASKEAGLDYTTVPRPIKRRAYTRAHTISSRPTLDDHAEKVWLGETAKP